MIAKITKMEDLSILNLLPDGCLVIDHKWNVVFWNPKLVEWTNFSEKELLGKSLLDLYPNLKEPKYYTRIKSILRGGPSAIFSAQFHKYLLPISGPSGELRVQHSRVASILLESEERYLACFIIQDISNLVGKVSQIKEAHQKTLAESRMREQAEVILKQEVDRRRVAQDLATQASKAKTEFLAKVSHELRTPLNAIIGYTEINLEVVQDGLKVRLDDLQRVHQAAGLLLNLINSLLKVSAIEAGKEEFQLEMINVSWLINHLTEMGCGLARRTGNEFLQDFKSLPEKIYCDQKKVLQVILNVLSNAFKYTTDGRVEISMSTVTEENRDYLQVEIIDNGRGMSEKVKQNIGKPFFQGDSSSDSELGSTGLGMAIARSYLDWHEGKIEVESEEGKGSKVTIKLPIDGPRLAAA